MTKKLQDKYLIRFDYGSTVGWQVRIHKNRGMDRELVKFFSRRKYSSWEETKEAARAHRDALISQHGLQHLLQTKHFSYRDKWAIKRNARNTSGVLGVTRATWGSTPFWKAYGNIQKERHQKYCKGDGVSSFIAACKFRKDLFGELQILDEDKMPCSKKELWQRLGL